MSERRRPFRRGRRSRPSGHQPQTPFPESYGDVDPYLEYPLRHRLPHQSTRSRTLSQAVNPTDLTTPAPAHLLSHSSSHSTIRRRAALKAAADKDNSSANREEAAEVEVEADTAIAISGTTAVADAISVDAADNVVAVVVDSSSNNRAVRAASRHSARHSLQ